MTDSAVPLPPGSGEPPATGTASPVTPPVEGLRPDSPWRLSVAPMLDRCD